MILSKCKSDPIITLLQTLQWLLISFRVKFRVSTRACMTPDDLHPPPPLWPHLFLHTPSSLHSAALFQGWWTYWLSSTSGPLVRMLILQTATSLTSQCFSVTFPVRHSLATLSKTPNSLHSWCSFHLSLLRVSLLLLIILLHTVYGQRFLSFPSLLYPQCSKIVPSPL